MDANGVVRPGSKQAKSRLESLTDFQKDGYDKTLESDNDKLKSADLPGCLPFPLDTLPVPSTLLSFPSTTALSSFLYSSVCLP